MCGSDYEQRRGLEKRCFGQKNNNVGIFRGCSLVFPEADLSPKEREGKNADRHRKKGMFQVKLRACYFYSYSEVSASLEKSP